MLYVNEELISTRDKTDKNKHFEVVTDYHKTIKELQDTYGKYLVVETKIKPYRDKNTGVHRFPGPRGLLLVSNVNRKDEDGSVIMEEMRYSPSVLKRDDKTGSLKHEDPNILIQRGEFTVDIQRNPDLAYYIMKCGYVGHTPAEGKKFHIYDSDLINRTNAEQRRIQGSVLNLIYSSLPEIKLRTLAKSFGVQEVGLKDIETVREHLFARLEENEKSKKSNPDSTFRGFTDFIESAEVKQHDQIAALCSDAIEAEKVVFQEDERRWVIDYKDGGSPYILKELSGEEFGDQVGALVNFLLTEQNMLRKVENVMGIGGDTKELPVITEDMIITESKVPVLKKWIKQLNPGVELKKTLKQEEAKMMLLDLLKQESVQETQG